MLIVVLTILKRRKFQLNETVKVTVTEGSF